MPPHRTIKLWPLVLLTVVVCSAGNLAAGLFGMLAAVARWPLAGSAASAHSLDVAGILLGGSAGLLASIVWCVLVIGRVLRRLRAETPPAPALLAPAAGWGALLGTTLALGLETSLTAVVGRWDVRVALWAVGNGAVVGTLLGLLAGLLALLAETLARPD